MADTPVFIIDLRKIREDKSENAGYINSFLEFRGVGGMKTDQEFFETHLSSDYDLLIFIKKSSLSHLINRLILHIASKAVKNHLYVTKRNSSRFMQRT